MQASTAWLAKTGIQETNDHFPCEIKPDDSRPLADCPLLVTEISGGNRAFLV